ncbi:hypothetical protein SH1V18_13800 [Vallitalea longa]|uniref:Uncharacterized protein n=1 Tax=Vallitalea longa TaxID=2936439 RepID=A0A9W5Y854_9FIRM|nr:hypothetical protein [Vallitalea longa]GKX28900.1 hypothetical protein SH1V18_13800 [Vallitalea longa]
MRQPKGEYGYINSQKKMYLRSTVIGLLIMAVIYVVDRFVFTEGNVLLIVVALLALPESQFFVKYILYRQFKEGKEEVYRKFEKISDRLVYLSSLAVIRGKKTLFYQIAVVSEKEIILLIDKKKTRKEVNEYRELIEKLISSKGFGAKVKVYNDEQEMYSYVITQLSILLNKINVDNQIALANVLLDNSI